MLRDWNYERVNFNNLNEILNSLKLSFYFHTPNIIKKIKYRIKTSPIN